MEVAEQAWEAPRTARWTLTLPNELERAVSECAEAEGKTAVYVVWELLAEALKERGALNGNYASLVEAMNQAAAPHPTR